MIATRFADPYGSGPLRRGSGDKPPVVRFSLRQRFIVAVPTENSRATWEIGFSASLAVTTRIRNSIGYGCGKLFITP